MSRIAFRPEVHGAGNVPRVGPVILAANHLSVVDSFLIPLVTPRRVSFLAKEEYFRSGNPKQWLTRAFIEGTDAIPVPRGGYRAAQESLAAALRVLEGGGAFGIHPEGSRSRDGRLYRGRTGIARMALEAHVPVVPVVMVDTDTMMPIGRRIPRIARVGVVIGEPLDFSRFEGMAGDRYILRSVTDEIMVALHRIGSQEYDDVYASTVKDRLKSRPAAS